VQSKTIINCQPLKTLDLYRGLSCLYEEKHIRSRDSLERVIGKLLDKTDVDLIPEFAIGNSHI
jgi:hypothetical protein